MTKARGGGKEGENSRPHRPTRITEASPTEQDYLASTKRLAATLSDLPAFVTGMQQSIAESLGANGVEGVDIDEINARVQMQTPNGKILDLDLATLRRMMQIMPGVAERRVNLHKTSGNAGIRRTAPRIIKKDHPLSDEEDEALRAHIKKLSDNF